MTPQERQIVTALAGCSFLPGSSPKRFIREMAARPDDYVLSPRQVTYLWSIAWSWRRQLRGRTVELARRMSGEVGLSRKAASKVFEQKRLEKSVATSTKAPHNSRSQLAFRKRQGSSGASDTPLPLFS